MNRTKRVTVILNPGSKPRETVEVAFTEAEAATLSKEAGAVDEGLSTYIRKVAEQAASPVDGDVAAAARRSRVTLPEFLRICALDASGQSELGDFLS